MPLARWPCVIGGSDAGAHLDLLATFNYATVLLEYAVRRHKFSPWKRRVPHDRRAGLSSTGFVNAGHVVPGWFADLVVFDPDLVGHQEWRSATTCPAQPVASMPKPTGSSTSSSMAPLLSAAASSRIGSWADFSRGRDTSTASLAETIVRSHPEGRQSRRTGLPKAPARLAERFSFAKSKTGLGSHVVDENICPPNGVTQTGPGSTWLDEMRSVL